MTRLAHHLRLLRTRNSPTQNTNLPLAFFTIFVLIISSTSCGYSILRPRAEWLKTENIRTLSIAYVGNESFKPGTDVVVRRAILRRLSSIPELQILSEDSRADARLKLTVTKAETVGISQTPSLSLPGGGGNTAVLINNLYESTLEIQAILLKSGDEKILLNQLFTDRQSYPTAAATGDLGRTAHLINESEFERTLAKSANNISLEIERAMLGVF